MKYIEAISLDEAIKHCLEVAEMYEEEADKDRASEEADNCLQCATDHKQLAEWLTELKDLREENKVLTSECDRLMKEKGELLNKVSGGDVLRICQLEEQLKNWREEYANLNKISYGFYEELKEAKRLLKLAVPIINNMFPEVGSCWGCANHDEATDRCKAGAFEECAEVCKWKHADEALKLLNDEK